MPRVIVQIILLVLTLLNYSKSELLMNKQTKHLKTIIERGEDEFLIRFPRLVKAVDTTNELWTKLFNDIEKSNYKLPKLIVNLPISLRKMELIPESILPSTYMLKRNKKSQNGLQLFKWEF